VQELALLDAARGAADAAIERKGRIVAAVVVGALLMLLVMVLRVALR
jgi:hypothetical protein